MMKNELRIISLSGGRSSGMMLKLLMENDQIKPTDRVVFANTGKELPETLDFIHEIETRWGVAVDWLEFVPQKPLFQVVNYETAAREGEPFEAWIKKNKYLPNTAQRFCTGNLKIKTIRRFVRSLKHRGQFENVLGFRYDEPNRVAKKKAQNQTGKDAAFHIMPLHEMRITKPMVANFWENQPFDLQIPSWRGNCDLCFMKGFYNLVWTIRENPALADWWIEMEKWVSANSTKKRKRNAQFNKEWNYAGLLHVAKNQTFIPLPSDDGESINCSCPN